MECNKTFLWFRVDFIALRYSTVIVILCNKNIDILQHNVLVVCTVSQSKGRVHQICIGNASRLEVRV